MTKTPDPLAPGEYEGQPMPNSLFFVFDGVDGAGKTTQIERFQDWLTVQGHATAICRDPGTTALGEQIRNLLLESHDLEIGNRAEMLLYMAARAQLVEEFIRPALERGETVISDRYLLANVVYQGHAGGLDPQTLWQIGAVATDDISPTHTFVLDVAPQAAQLRREKDRDPDRLERRGLPYFERVRQGFLTEARIDPNAISIIDASQPPDQVERQVRAKSERFIGEASSR